MGAYELAWEHLEEASKGNNFALVAVLTGLEIDDIKEVNIEVCRVNGISRYKTAWGGQHFIKLFRALGFNTNDRFVKFDPNTDKPCIIRTTSFQKGYWYAFIFDGKLVDNIWTLEQFHVRWKKLKITSMLQVWI